jgi:hypothetical protein
MPYLINSQEEIVLINHIPGSRKYRYGLDEYCISQMYEIESLAKRNIFLNMSPDHEWFQSEKYDSNFIQNFNVISVDENYSTDATKLSIFFIFRILLKLNLVTEKLSGFDLIKKVEILREDKNIISSLTPYEVKTLRNALAIIPNKYRSWRTVHNLKIGKRFFSDFFKRYSIKKIDIKKLYEIYEKSPIIKSQVIDKINNETFVIPCPESLIKTPFYFCDPDGTKNDIKNCVISDFASGFYYEPMPNLESGILRRPTDLLAVMNDMDKNNLKQRFNKSLYKRIKTNTKLLNDLTPLNTVDNNNGNINIISQIIPSSGEVYDIVSEVKNNLSPGNDKLRNPLIWKALNYSGYDIPVQWFDTTNILTNNTESIKFNEYVKKLSGVNNWAKNTMEILLNNPPSINHDDYQMDKWRRKYLKYKQKYLDLNNYFLIKKLENLSNKVDEKLKQIELNEKLEEMKTTLY